MFYEVVVKNGENNATYVLNAENDQKAREEILSFHQHSHGRQAEIVSVAEEREDTFIKSLGGKEQ